MIGSAIVTYPIPGKKSLSVEGFQSDMSTAMSLRKSRATQRFLY